MFRVLLALIPPTATASNVGGGLWGEQIQVLGKTRKRRVQERPPLTHHLMGTYQATA